MMNSLLNLDSAQVYSVDSHFPLQSSQSNQQKYNTYNKDNNNVLHYCITLLRMLLAKEVNDSIIEMFFQALVSKNSILCWRASYK